jgi:IS1 family transposase
VRWVDLATSSPIGKAIILKLDEMWHYIRKKRRKLWTSKGLDQDTGQLLDWECGRHDRRTLKKMINRLRHWAVNVYCTDK